MVECNGDNDGENKGSNIDSEEKSVLEHLIFHNMYIVDIIIIDTMKIRI